MLVFQMVLLDSFLAIISRDRFSAKWLLKGCIFLIILCSNFCYPYFQCQKNASFALVINIFSRYS